MTITDQTEVASSPDVPAAQPADPPKEASALGREIGELYLTKQALLLYNDLKKTNKVTEDLANKVEEKAASVYEDVIATDLGRKADDTLAATTKTIAGLFASSQDEEDGRQHSIIAVVIVKLFQLFFRFFLPTMLFRWSVDIALLFTEFALALTKDFVRSGTPSALTAKVQVQGFESSEETAAKQPHKAGDATRKPLETAGFSVISTWWDVISYFVKLNYYMAKYIAVFFVIPYLTYQWYFLHAISRFMHRLAGLNDDNSEDKENISPGPGMRNVAAAPLKGNMKRKEWFADSVVNRVTSQVLEIPVFGLFLEKVGIERNFNLFARLQAAFQGEQPTVSVAHKDVFTAMENLKKFVGEEMASYLYMDYIYNEAYDPDDVPTTESSDNSVEYSDDMDAANGIGGNDQIQDIGLAKSVVQPVVSPSRRVRHLSESHSDPRETQNREHEPETKRDVVDAGVQTQLIKLEEEVKAQNTSADEKSARNASLPFSKSRKRQAFLSCVERVVNPEFAKQLADNLEWRELDINGIERATSLLTKIDDGELLGASADIAISDATARYIELGYGTPSPDEQDELDPDIAALLASNTPLDTISVRTDGDYVSDSAIKAFMYVMEDDDHVGLDPADHPLPPSPAPDMSPMGKARRHTWRSKGPTWTGHAVDTIDEEDEPVFKEEEKGDDTSAPVTDLTSEKTIEETHVSGGGPEDEAKEKPTLEQPGETIEKPTLEQAGQNNEKPTLEQSGETNEDPTLEQSGETNVDPTLEQSGETNVDPTLEQSGETNVDPTLEKPGETNVDPTLEQSGETNVDPTLEKPGETNVDRTLEQSGETNVDLTLEQSGETNVDPTLEKPGETNVDPTLEQPGETNVDPTLEQPGETNVDPTLEQPGETNVDRTPEQSGETNVDPTLEQSGETNVDPTLEQSGETNVDPTLEQSGETNVDPTLEQSGETNVDRTLEQSGETNVDRTPEQHGETNVDPTLEQSGETNVDPTLEQTGETNVDPTLEQSGETNVDPTLEQSGETNVDPTLEQSGETNVDPTLEQTGETNVDPTLKQTGETNVDPTLEQSGETNVDPTLEQTGETNVDPTLEQSGETNVDPTFEQSGETNVDPPLEQSGESNVDPPLEQTGETNVDPTLEQTGETNVDPTLEQTGETNVDPTLEQTGETNKPTLKQSEQTNEKPALGQSGETEEKPKFEQSEQTTEKPTVEESEQTNEKPVNPSSATEEQVGEQDNSKKAAAVENRADKNIEEVCEEQESNHDVQTNGKSKVQPVAPKVSTEAAETETHFNKKADDIDVESAHHDVKDSHSSKTAHSEKAAAPDFVLPTQKAPNLGESVSTPRTSLSSMSSFDEHESKGNNGSPNNLPKESTEERRNTPKVGTCTDVDTGFATSLQE